MEIDANERLMVKIPTTEERSKREKELRKTRAENLLDFGVKFLNCALEGIARNDLIILGAPTGTGKTELVTHIGAFNAWKGKRILFFPLEAEECEIESRIKFKLAAQAYFNDQRPDKVIIRSVNYRNWYHNKLGEAFAPYEAQADERFQKSFKTFRTVYRKTEFKIEDLQRHLMLFKDETDLVIIDHLNYFDTDEPNENKAVTDIVKRIRDLALLSSLPIILVAHIKKADKKFRTVAPEIDDFHGTSNITKIATKAILLSPDRDAPVNPKKFSTFIRVAKFRVDGSVSRYIAKCAFNIETNRYEDDFILGTTSDDGRGFAPIEGRHLYPAWALSGGST